MRNLFTEKKQSVFRMVAEDLALAALALFLVVEVSSIALDLVREWRCLL
jgi:hypothetical protein